MPGTTPARRLPQHYNIDAAFVRTLPLLLPLPLLLLLLLLGRCSLRCPHLPAHLQQRSLRLCEVAACSCVLC